MIFGGSETLFQGSENEHPFIVPIAVPLFAGPSSIATVIFTASKYAEHRMDVWLALLLAWFASAIVVLGAKYIRKALGNRGLLAMERLMGMLLTAIAVEMFFQGIKAVFLKA